MKSEEEEGSLQDQRNAKDLHDQVVNEGEQVLKKKMLLNQKDNRFNLRCCLRR